MKFVHKLLRSFARLLGKRRSPLFSELKASWASAESSVAGYSHENIASQVRSAIGKVRDGESAHERDGLNFPQIEYSWPLLAGLLLVAAQNKGKLNVVDFGGSLGTTFFQNRLFLEQVPEVSWCVVEQPTFVEIGKNEFATNRLRFESDLTMALETTQPQVVIISSSLQYVEKPFEILERISVSSAQHLIIDRTPFHGGEKDILTMQTVPPEIYDAKYPAWIFGYDTFFEFLKSGWKVLAEFKTLEQEMSTTQGTPFFWRGAHLLRTLEMKQ